MLHERDYFMMPENDKEWKILKIRAKAMFLSKLFYHDEKITDAINDRESIKDGNGRKIKLSQTEWHYLSFLLQKGVQEFEERDGNVTVFTEEKDYIIEKNRIKHSFLSLFGNSPSGESSLRLANLADMIIIDSALSSAKDDAHRLLRDVIIDRVNQANLESDAEQQAWANEGNSLINTWELLAFRAYFCPKYGYYLLENLDQMDYFPTQKEIQTAVKLFEAVEEQLRTDPAARRNYKSYDSLLDKTIDGLSTRLNRDDYMNALKNLPRYRSWKRIIGYAISALLAAILITAAAILAISTFGIATPLAIFGLHFVVNYIVGGYAVTTGLAAAGLFAGAIYKATGTKSEVTLRGEDYLRTIPTISPA